VNSKEQYKKPVEIYEQDRTQQLSYSCIDEEKHIAHPLQQVINNFVAKRVAFLNSNNDGTVAPKPSLQFFIDRFEEEMMSSEVAYK
jgi:hypothetical protein